MINTYTPDMPRPSCPDCASPIIEIPSNPEQVWSGTCAKGHNHSYQLETGGPAILNKYTVRFTPECDNCGSPERMGLDQILCYPCLRKLRIYAPDLEISWSCCLKFEEPDWKEFSGIELAGVKEEDGECEIATDTSDISFYSLFGRTHKGFAECLHDFPDGCFDIVAIQEECQKLADRIGLKLEILSQ